MIATTENITTEYTTIVDHYAKLANSYASKAGQLYGMLEVLPIITQGLSRRRTPQEHQDCLRAG
jgi:hypothetical protein